MHSISRLDSKQKSNNKSKKRWSIVAGLNYNIIKEKELKKLLEFKRADTDFSSHQRYWEKFE